MQKEFDFKKLRQELAEIEIVRQEIRTWTEDFEDEDTHEVISIERQEIMSYREPTADEAARLAEIEADILAHITELDDDQLFTVYNDLGDLTVFLEAMKRNLSWALDDDDDDINFVTYTITAANAASLDAIETLIGEVCQRKGMPENITDGLPMNLPYSDVMKVLIGEAYPEHLSKGFTGLIEYAERDADALVLNCSCTWRCIRPFAEALKETFGVNVEIENRRGA